MEEERIYEDYEIVLTLKHKSKNEARIALIQKFLEEKGGYWKEGKKHVTRYKYVVEYANGKKIYLLRPTRLNKGMDFQVHAEDFRKFKNGKDRPPSHKDIFEDLKLKKVENSKNFSKLMELINKVWNCEEPDDVIKNVVLNFKEGASVEMILKILKWLFIEQDMTYWNYDGRGMLKKAIDEHTNK